LQGQWNKTLIIHSALPPALNGATESSVQVIKQGMRKMGSAIALQERLANFLLVYRSHFWNEAR